MLGDALWPLRAGLCGHRRSLWRAGRRRRRPSWQRATSLGRAAARRLQGRRAATRARRALARRSRSAGLLHAVGVQRNLGEAIGVVAIVAAVLVPRGRRRGSCVWCSSLSFERAARIREQERAEVAAHLHDSVLQTLALIQKRAGDPREVAGLARRQERELRSWLLERPDADEGDSVAAALERVGGRGGGAAPRADRGGDRRRRPAGWQAGGARAGRARGDDERGEVRRQRARRPVRRGRARPRRGVRARSRRRLRPARDPRRPTRRARLDHRLAWSATAGARACTAARARAPRSSWSSSCGRAQRPAGHERRGHAS